MEEHVKKRQWQTNDVAINGTAATPKPRQRKQQSASRRAASSTQRAASSEQQAASSTQQAARSKQHAASSKQHAASSKQHAASSKQQAASSTQHAASSRLKKWSSAGHTQQLIIHSLSDAAGNVRKRVSLQTERNSKPCVCQA
jgi:methyl-accepting chemotaxis protein